MYIDAYIYVNCVESRKGLSKPGNPHFSPPLPPPALVQPSVAVEKTQFWMLGRWVKGVWLHLKHTVKRQAGETLF